MELENLAWRIEDGVGVVTFNRPKALNALDSKTLGELAALLEAASADRTLRAIVLTGAGDKAFVAGADIAEMAALSPLEARRFAERGERTLARLEALAVPTIAAVNGFALGGGCELAMACDLVYASEKARFGQPEVNLGLVPAFGGTTRLARRVGPARALELILSGDMIDAAKAKEIGLALEVLPPEQLLPFALEKARKIASRAPAAVALAKRVVHVGLALDTAAAAELERQAFGLLAATEDTKEGLRAFLEKRPAHFKGA
jgi:enoyl-CoA hydratase